MKLKKLLSVVLCLVLMLNIFSVTASADSPQVKSYITQKNGYTNVKLSCGGSYTLYYTTDGSKPDSSDKKYTGGTIKIKKPSTLRVSIYNGKTRVGGAKADIKVRLKTPTATFKGYDGEYTVYRVKALSGSTLYYTSDGSTPSKSNGKKVKLTDFDLRVVEGKTVKLRAYKSGWTKSKVCTAVGADSVDSGYTVDYDTDDNDTHDSEKSGSPDDFTSEVLRLINEERASRGLSELKSKDSLSAAANVRAAELIKKFDHKRPDGRDCFTALKEAGVSYYCCAENIAAGQRTPEAVVKSWMSSPGHRGNILNSSYKYVGIGHATGGGYGDYWTQLFIG